MIEVCFRLGEEPVLLAELSGSECPVVLDLIEESLDFVFCVEDGALQVLRAPGRFFGGPFGQHSRFFVFYPGGQRFGWLFWHEGSGKC